MTAYMPPLADVFDAARTQFTALLVRLQTAAVRAAEHSTVEALIEHDGREVLRQVFAGYLRARAQAEPRRDAVAGADGVARTHREPGDRPLVTTFGAVRVPRLAYRTRTAPRLHPLDAALNLPAETYSHHVRWRVATWAAELPFDGVVTQLAQHTGARVGKRQVEQLVVRAAQDFDAFYDTRAARPACDVAPTVLVLTFDGKGVPMRRDDLRAATQRKAAAATRRVHRLRPGEKPHRKRMAQVAAVYGVARFPRAPEDVVRELRPDDEPLPARPRPTAKRVWASLKHEPAAVIAAAFAEAEHRDPRRRARWVGLVDGSPTQIEAVTAQAAATGVDLTLVLDLIHVLEYLWRAAAAFAPPASAAAEAWVTGYLYDLLAGRARQVAGAIRRSATRRGVTGAARAAVDRCADYLLRHQTMLRYDEYLADGLPIATGVIEGACRHLVKDRMERTGARWRIAGAEAVLQLRALHASGDFEAYWAFHLDQEFERNHARRYAPGESLRAAS
jgi:hypothetical protein